MGTKKMRIRFGRDGRTEIKVEGGEGDDCLAFTRAVEDALGVVEHREPCPPDEDPLVVHTRDEVKEGL